MKSDCTLEFSGSPFDGNSKSRHALIAHWSPSSCVSRSILTFALALLSNGFAVTVVSSADSTDPLEELHFPDTCIRILRRPNEGHDFGSWTNAMRFDRGMLDAEELLIANDSLIGPFASIDTLLNASSTSDVSGLTLSTERGFPHLQSFWLHHHSPLSMFPELTRFWLQDVQSGPKSKIVKDYEIGYARQLSENGVTYSPHFETPLSWDTAQNPTLLEWHSLLELGMPFVKRELLWRPLVGPGAGFMPQEVARRFNTNIRDWTPTQNLPQNNAITDGIVSRLRSDAIVYPAPFVDEFRQGLNRLATATTPSLQDVDSEMGATAACISSIWQADVSQSLSARISRSGSRWRRRWYIARTDPRRAWTRILQVIGIER